MAKNTNYKPVTIIHFFTGKQWGIFLIDTEKVAKAIEYFLKPPFIKVEYYDYLQNKYIKYDLRKTVRNN